MSTSNTKPKRINKARSERLARQLCEGQADILQLADREKMKIAALADWSNDPDTLRRLVSLCCLSDLRAQLLLNRYRAHAVARLFELAQDESGGETARKACVDLLNLNVVKGGGHDQVLGSLNDDRTGGADDQISYLPEDWINAIREFLAHVGQSDDRIQPEDHARGSEA